MAPASTTVVLVSLLVSIVALVALVFTLVMAMATAMDGGQLRRKRAGGVFVGDGATGHCGADGGGGE